MSDVSMEDFAGTWVIDAEKSYSKSERRKLSGYTLTITLKDNDLKLGWDYTIAGRRSNYSETLTVDGKEHEYPRTRGGDEWEPWAESTKWKNGKLIRQFAYRMTRQRYGAYRDRVDFSLDKTRHVLTLTTKFVNAGDPPPSRDGSKQVRNPLSVERKLVFNRKAN